MIVALLGLIAFALIGPRLNPNQNSLARIAVRGGTAEALADLVAETGIDRVQLEVEGRDPPALRRDLESAIAGLDGLEMVEEDAPTLRATLADEKPQLRLGLDAEWQREIIGTPPNWLALVPPFVAILLALTLRRTIPALLLGVWAGAVLLSEGAWWARLGWGTWSAVGNYIIKVSFFDYEVLWQPATWTPANFQIQIILFVLGLIGTVGIANRSGGIVGVMNLILGTVRGARSALAATYAMGLAIFFDDYSNTLIVGNTMRPLTDQLRISREKLSYVVDSTAAPVAGISVLSTWVAYEVSLFAGPVAELGMGDNPFAIFLRTVPYRFYCLTTLMLVGTLIFMGRDYGPMLKAERRARTTGAVNRPGAKPTVSSALDAARFEGNRPARWYNAVVPIVVVLISTVVLLWSTGRSGLPAEVRLSALTLEYWRNILAAADSAQALCCASWLGFFTAFSMATLQRILTPLEALRAGISSFSAVTNAISILLLAWAIGAICRDLGTAHFLIALLEGHVPPLVFPAGLFLLSCLVSFSTGSSWSTMSIVLPNTVLLAHAVGGASAIGAEAMTIMCIGAVLEGSIFGDHCSPISDTTILSSTSSGADHMDHVRTQLPYAITAMLIALGLGYIPAAAGFPVGLSWLAGAGVLLLVVRLVGRRTDSAAPGETEPISSH